MTITEKKGWKCQIVFELFNIYRYEKLSLNVDMRTLEKCADLLIDAHERLTPEKSTAAEGT